jgi:hypothetical protein
MKKIDLTRYAGRWITNEYNEYVGRCRFDNEYVGVATNEYVGRCPTLLLVALSGLYNNSLRPTNNNNLNNNNKNI